MCCAVPLTNQSRFASSDTYYVAHNLLIPDKFYQSELQVAIGWRCRELFTNLEIKTVTQSWTGRASQIDTSRHSCSPLHCARPAPWAIKAIEKLMKAFIWQGTSSVAGGNSTVAWEKVCRPTDMGGLSIPNLKLQGYALCLQPEQVVQQFFAASLRCELGNGDSILFWTDKWLEGKSIEQLAPWVFNGVPKHTRQTRTVREALTNDQWIRDITGARTIPLIYQFL